MKKLIIIFVLSLFKLCGYAVDFKFNDISYTIIDEINKTCKTKEGSITKVDGTVQYRPGNNISGIVKIPTIVNYNNESFTVIEIGDYGFQRTNIESVTIPATITRIGVGAFEQCSNLREILEEESIKNNIIEIGDYAFRNCNALSIFPFGNHLSIIGNYAFANCPIPIVFISKSVKSIGLHTFEGNKELKELIIEDGETNLDLRGIASSQAIGDYKLYYGRECTGASSPFGSTFVELEIGPMVKNIPAKSFSSSKIKSLAIPNNVVSIENFAFSGCTNLTEVSIGSGVTSVLNDVFDGCKNLGSIILGKNIKEIEDNAFNFENLSAVKSLNTEPPAIKPSTFNTKTEETGILIVPNESVAKYRQSAYWTNFFKIEGADFSGEGGEDRPNISEDEITVYIYMERDETKDFKELIEANVIVSAWESSNDDIAEVNKKGRVDAWEYGKAYITAKDDNGDVVATFCVFVCPTITVEHGDGLIYRHHVVYKSIPKLYLAEGRGYKLAGVTHDGVEIDDDLISNDGYYTSMKPIMDDSVINLSLETLSSGWLTGTESAISPSTVRLYVDGRRLNVVGASPEAKVVVTDLKGYVLYTRVGLGIINFDANGAYLVNVSGEEGTFKILIR